MVLKKEKIKILFCVLIIFSIVVAPAFAVYDEFQVNQEVIGLAACGNGVCEAGENSSNCPSDCPAAPVCGNGICEAGENSDNCPNDCPSGGPGPIDITPPIIYNLQIDKITTNSAAISWDTSEQAICKLVWGKTVNYEAGSITENAFYRTHSTDLSGLLPDTLYHFKIFCQDTAKNSSETADYRFSTLPLPDTTPPANVSNFEAIPGDGQVGLKWKNPPDADFKGVRILRSEKFFPLDPWNGALIYEGGGESFVDIGLTNNTRYYYTAFAFDGAGNFSSGAIVSAIPRPAIPPEEAPIEILPPEIPEAPPEEIPPEIRDLLDELTLKDFEFWQEGRQLEIIDDKVTAKPEKPLKILLKYEKVPEVLKTIAINFLRNDGKSFAFLLKIDLQKAAFIATLIPPEPQEYGMKIQVLDYKNQRLKNIDGRLEIEQLAVKFLTFWEKVVIKFRQYIIYIIFISLLILLLLFLVFLWFLRKRREKEEKGQGNF